MKRESGFTLVEVLIALFIFTIISLMLVSALRLVMNVQSGTESKAERLRDLQMALLILSRDIEQAVNRPIVNAEGQDEAAFVGKEQEFQFTHTGFANSVGVVAQCSLQRSGYSWKNNTLFRTTWPVLDQTPETKPQQRSLLINVTEAHFQYLDYTGHMHDRWPAAADAEQSLPRAVRVYLTIGQWGKMTQLYLISAHKNENALLANKAKEKNVG